MARSIAPLIGGIAIYLLLTAGSGNILLWSLPEIILSVVCGIFVYAIAPAVMPPSDRVSFTNPKRWFAFLAYLFPFFGAMAKANLNVAKLVITGKINPGIVRIKPELKNKFAVTMLANSITLTPGTLTVDVDEETNDLYVHWIDITPEAIKECEEKGYCDYKPVCGTFPEWARRVAE